MIMLQCKMCGGSLAPLADAEHIAVCESCGSIMTLPHTSDDEVLNMYRRAEEYRRTRDFDQAQLLYEHIAQAHAWDAEAWWGVVLCRFGIEYVRDASSRTYKPTLHRMQMSSVLQDASYRQALSHADAVAREHYQRWAQEIDAINRRFLTILVKEPPFDVFISYKELDESGQRTADSILAQSLYDRLTQAGYKVFLSRVTLEGKLGEEYEPHIFAALHSSRVMLLVGTKKAHINAFWVKNEWQRYLHLSKAAADKHLIPVLQGMAAEELPDELSMLQTADVSQPAAMDALMLRIRQLMPSEDQTDVDEEQVLQDMIDSARLYLLKGEYEKAAEKLDAAMDIDVTCAMLHLMMLQAKLQCRQPEELIRHKDLDRHVLWQRAARFAQGEVAVLMQDLQRNVRLRAEREQLEQALACFSDEWSDARTLGDKECLLEEYAGDLAKPGASELRERCRQEVRRMQDAFAQYQQQLQTASDDELLALLDQCKVYQGSQAYESTVEKFRKRADALRAAQALKTGQAQALALKKRFTPSYRCDENGRAYRTFADITPDHLWEIADAAQLFPVSAERHIVCVADDGAITPQAVLVEKNGTVCCEGLFSKAVEKALASAREIVSASVSEYHIALINRVGQVIVLKKKLFGASLETLPWTAVAEVYPYLRQGLMARTADGRILAEAPVDGLKEVSGWTNLRHFSVHCSLLSGTHAVGLTAQGCVLAAGASRYQQCDVKDWQNVIDVEAAENCTVALTASGEILVAGTPDFAVDKLHGAAALFKTGRVVGAVHRDGTVCVPVRRQGGVAI